MQLLRLYIKKPTANSTFAIGGVSCSADSFVVAESSVLRMNICAENPAHRKSANRLFWTSAKRHHENSIDIPCFLSQNPPVWQLK